MPAVATRPASKAEAKMRAQSIRTATEQVWSLLYDAWVHDDHVALGYDTWAGYVDAEFNLSAGQSYRIIDQAAVILAIEETTGQQVPVSQRQAAVLVDEAPKVAKRVAKAVERGTHPSDAVAAEVAKRSAPKVERSKPAKKAAPIEATATERRKPEKKLRAVSDDMPPAINAAFVGLFKLDPQATAVTIGKRDGTRLAKELDAWLVLFRGALSGAPAGKVSAASCSHPINRRIGNQCAVCGGTVGK